MKTLIFTFIGMVKDLSGEMEKQADSERNPSMEYPNRPCGCHKMNPECYCKNLLIRDKDKVCYDCFTGFHTDEGGKEMHL